MQKKKLIPCMFIKNAKAVKGYGEDTLLGNGDPLELAMHYSNHGADELIVLDLSAAAEGFDQSLKIIKEISRQIDMPILGGSNIRRVEDVKKLIYAGCKKVFLDFSRQENRELLEAVSRRFGRDKMAVYAEDPAVLENHQVQIEEYADCVLLQSNEKDAANAAERMQIPVPSILGDIELPELLETLKKENIYGVCTGLTCDPQTDLMHLKQCAKEAGIAMHTFESSLSWSELKRNEDDMIPVIVQDYKTLEVLMMAYMNEEAFDATMQTGRMTYWSRSRKELWEKGLTSGHYQYVKQLSIDCDNDTILAKVLQAGAACHTGSYSCFYRDLAKKEFNQTNPMKVFDEVFGVILDRKEHPKEGSYTNYLFDKGIDKILKKVGEEAAEIIIAAKNPDPEEIKYEISDFLYHVMVLMAERGVSWEDITRELAQR